MNELDFRLSKMCPILAWGESSQARGTMACGFVCVSVGNLDRGGCCGVADVNAVLLGICNKVVSGGASIYNCSVIGLIGGGWD
jgi:hypothetical protein